MSYISTLKLHHFRCYEALKLQEVHKGLVVLYGPNGAGKTNVLEAVSLLTPGRGLRNATNEELKRVVNITSNSPHPNPLPIGEREAFSKNAGEGVKKEWVVAASVDTGGAVVQIGTGFDQSSNKRIIKINGIAAKSQMALADYLSCLWLTPQMDRLFIEGVSARRRFFDKLVFTFDSAHAGRVSRYENAMAQRSKILRGERVDTAWLLALEQQMAQTSVAIGAARLSYLEQLQKACAIVESGQEQFFPKARLLLSGFVEQALLRDPALAVEGAIADGLMHAREKDSQNGGAVLGAHKTDFCCYYAKKEMPADQCSTGEQKALLIGVILAHARMMRAERGGAPILLLDEVAAHLDTQRRAALFDLLDQIGGQVWMTGTEEPPFSTLTRRAQFWQVERGCITPK